MNIGKNKTFDEQKITMLNIFLIRYSNIIILLLTILFLVFSFFYILKPKYTNIVSQVRSSNKNKEEIKTALTNYMGALNRYNTIYKNISTEEKEIIYKLLPRSEPSENLFAEIENVINGSGFKLIDISIEKEKGDTSGKKQKRAELLGNKNPYTINGAIETKLSLTVSGLDGYYSFKKLVTVLENNMRIINLREVSFSNDGDSIDLELSVYNFKE